MSAEEPSATLTQADSQTTQAESQTIAPAPGKTHVPFLIPRRREETIIIAGRVCEVYCACCKQCSQWAFFLNATGLYKCRCGFMGEVFRLRAGDLVAGSAGNLYFPEWAYGESAAQYLTNWIFCTD